MAVVWADFVEKVKEWADRESNDFSFRFSVVLNNDFLILSSKSISNNKVYKLKYTKAKYYRDREKNTDKDILPILFQLLKEKYKNTHWSIVGLGRRA
jgi:hypothetical protein